MRGVHCVFLAFSLLAGWTSGVPWRKRQAPRHPVLEALWQRFGDRVGSQDRVGHQNLSVSPYLDEILPDALSLNVSVANVGSTMSELNRLLLSEMSAGRGEPGIATLARPDGLPAHLLQFQDGFDLMLYADTIQKGTKVRIRWVPKTDRRLYRESLPSEEVPDLLLRYAHANRIWHRLQSHVADSYLHLMKTINPQFRPGLQHVGMQAAAEIHFDRLCSFVRNLSGTARILQTVVVLVRLTVRVPKVELMPTIGGPYDYEEDFDDSLARLPRALLEERSIESHDWGSNADREAADEGVRLMRLYKQEDLSNEKEGLAEREGSGWMRNRRERPLSSFLEVSIGRRWREEQYRRPVDPNAYQVASAAPAWVELDPMEWKAIWMRPLTQGSELPQRRNPVTPDSPCSQEAITRRSGTSEHCFMHPDVDPSSRNATDGFAGGFAGRLWKEERLLRGCGGWLRKDTVTVFRGRRADGYRGKDFVMGICTSEGWQFHRFASLPEQEIALYHRLCQDIQPKRFSERRMVGLAGDFGGEEISFF